MNQTVLPSGLKNLQIPALIVGVIAIGLAVAGAFDPNLGGMKQFLHSYLYAYLFWLGFALGCLILLMVHHVAGGRWGFIGRRIFEAGMMTMPLMAILFIPVVLDMKLLYEWADPSHVYGDELLMRKSSYLDVDFFKVRAVFYWIVWIAGAFFLYTWSKHQDTAERGDFRDAKRMRHLSAAGIWVYGMTITFASVDWAMSLEPHWFSAIYGVTFGAGQALTAMAFTIVLLWLLSKTDPISDVLEPGRVDDFGKFMFGFTILWAYVGYAQYIIQWSGNLPEETPWYIRRVHNDWHIVAWLLVGFHFFVPFFALLSTRRKRNINALALIAGGMLVMRLVDMFWLIMPSFYQTGFSIHWMDIVAPIGIGGIWFAVFLWLLSQRPLLPLNDDNHDPRMRTFSH